MLYPIRKPMNLVPFHVLASHSVVYRLFAHFTHQLEDLRLSEYTAGSFSQI